jgi:cathepsin B
LQYFKALPYSVFNNAEAIKAEIFLNGRILTGFLVCQDFFSYKSDIYQLIPGLTYKGGHADKFIGWGIKNGIDYWITKNTWGSALKK